MKLKSLIFLVLGGIVIAIFSCMETPTAPDPATVEELNKIPFDKLTGKIFFRRVLDGMPDEYYFMMIDADEHTFKEIAYFYPNVPANLAISPDGTSILFSLYVFKGVMQSFYWQMYVMTIADRKIQNVTPSYSDDSYGSWSPDGKKISFWSNRNFESAIWMVDLEKDTSYSLVKVARDARTRAPWTPDGESIIVSGTNSADKAILFRLNVTTLEKDTLLTSELSEYVVYKHLSISPDGNRLAFSTAHLDGIWEIWTLDLNSGTTFQVTSEDSDWHPVWSPDGEWIMFNRGYLLYIIKADGKDLTQVTHSDHIDQYPSWLP